MHCIRTEIFFFCDPGDRMFVMLAKVFYSLEAPKMSSISANRVTVVSCTLMIGTVHDAESVD